MTSRRWLVASEAADVVPHDDAERVRTSDLAAAQATAPRTPSTPSESARPRGGGRPRPRPASQRPERPCRSGGLWHASTPRGRASGGLFTGCALSVANHGLEFLPAAQVHARDPRRFMVISSVMSAGIALTASCRGVHAVDPSEVLGPDEPLVELGHRGGEVEPGPPGARGLPQGASRTSPSSRP